MQAMMIAEVYVIIGGAGGRTRTDTTFYGPGILSPVRLPFRHTGYKEGSYLGGACYFLVTSNTKSGQNRFSFFQAQSEPR